MKLIVGLGNPGRSYEGTRHNIGFMVADRLARELGTETLQWKSDVHGKALTTRAGEVMLVKPQLFVNNTGIAVKAVADMYKMPPEDIWVIHDDLDLPLGKIRIRTQGGSAGHNGVTSILTHLGSDRFVRFRLGIGRGKEDVTRGTRRNLHHRSVIAFVLSRFRREEAGSLRHLIAKGTEAVRLALHDGLDRAMQRFN
jgi:PTH1 family peptidyl-tRNA hydrolase